MKKFLACAVAALVLGTGIAVAQYTPPAPVVNVNPTDLVPVIVKGVATVQSQFANPTQIAGAPGYQNLGVITTGNTYTFGHAVVNMFAQPSGTLAAVTLTTEASPSDGQRECFLSTQTTTSLTWNANTGQSINGAPTAGVANAGACMTYVASSATWYRS